MADPIVLRHDRGAVAQVTLNAPGSLNALSDAMIAALQETFDNIAADDRIRVVVLSANGKAFCAGHDLKEMQAARQSPDGGTAAFADLFDRCTRLMLTIQRLPQPVIAQVHGVAVAAGCQLVATCDMAVAGQSARFGVNGVNIGLFCSTPMVALTRAVPPKKAMEMLVTGRLIEAAEAEAVGLITRAVDDTELAEETSTLAATVASKLGAAVAIGKRAFYDQLALDTEAAYQHTGEVMVRNLMQDATEEGIQAFIEKRPPNWTE